MDPKESTEVVFSECCPQGTKECSGCWTCWPYANFERGSGQEGHWVTCLDCRNKRTAQRGRRQRANPTSVSSAESLTSEVESLLVYSEKKTPEACQIAFFARQEISIGGEAGYTWLIWLWANYYLIKFLSLSVTSINRTQKSVRVRDTFAGKIFSDFWGVKYISEKLTNFYRQKCRAT